MASGKVDLGIPFRGFGIGLAAYVKAFSLLPSLRAGFSCLGSWLSSLDKGFSCLINRLFSSGSEFPCVDGRLSYSDMPLSCLDRGISCLDNRLSCLLNYQTIIPCFCTQYRVAMHPIYRALAPYIGCRCTHYRVRRYARSIGAQGGSVGRLARCLASGGRIWRDILCIFVPSSRKVD